MDQIEEEHVHRKKGEDPATAYLNQRWVPVAPSLEAGTNQT